MREYPSNVGMRLRLAAALSIAYLPLSPAMARENREILPSISSRAEHHELVRPAGVPADADLESGHAVIGHIDILIGNVFDTSDPGEDRLIPRLANRLHIRTRTATVQSLLLFREGDAYSGRSLEESERILRTTRYLYDARIRPIAWHDGKVDVEVRTRDVWTLNPGLSFGRGGGKNTSGFEVQELNFLGFGSELSAGYRSGVDRNSTTFRYSDRQLLHSWWGIDAADAENSDGRMRQLSLKRPFYALDAHWAGGVSASDDTRIDSQYDLGEIVNRFHTREKQGTLYAGWSSGLQNGAVQRWTVGVTEDDNRFSAVTDSPLTTVLPPDRKLSYPWVGYEWLEDRFVRARNRDQIEKTEDFYLGWHFSARMGHADGAFGADRSAWIFQSHLDKGFQATDRQTVLLAGQVAGRIEKGDFINTVGGASARYYFKQTPRRLLFLSLSADAASRLDADQQLLLGGDNGLRGYPLRFQGGDGRWLFTIEQRLYSNWFPFRLVNVGGAVFYDMGRTWGDNPLGTPSRGLLRDIGVGLRLGNSRSALGNVLHVDVAVPLDRSAGIKGAQIIVETQRSF